jgi:hypothetical protein
MEAAISSVMNHPNIVQVRRLFDSKCNVCNICSSVG